jgi:hypothetical protein
MIVLQEKIEGSRSEILEEKTGGRRYIIEGICIQTNIENRNKRKYPKENVMNEIVRYIKEDIAANRALGELNHPTGDPRINYENVSHKFLSLTESGDNWIGKAVVTKNTPKGSVVAGLMDEGVAMGISTRAVGSVKKKNGVNIVQEDFHLISAGDIVSDPSAPDAYLTNLMEGKEWVWANGILVEKEAEIRGLVNTAARKKQLNEEGLKRLFNHILNQY